MPDAILALAATAAFIGVTHTLAGPDHYLPFIMMSRAQKWSPWKTSAVTFLCGIGHVLSSVLLGFAGVAIGIALGKLEAIEGVRGEYAAWALIAFGFVYAIWGIRQAYRNKPHSHWHAHNEGVVHDHEHTHHGEHAHAHQKTSARVLTPWLLFTIFVLGPCEPLIPILMYPAAKESFLGLLLVTGVFAIATIATMMIVVMIASAGLRVVRLGPIERFSHAIAGGAICLSGLAISLLGL